MILHPFEACPTHPDNSGTGKIGTGIIRVRVLTLHISVAHVRQPCTARVPTGYHTDRAGDSATTVAVKRRGRKCDPVGAVWCLGDVRQCELQPAQSGDMRGCWTTTALVLLGVSCAASAGLAEVSVGRFVDITLNHSSPTEFVLHNIPSNVSFILFQVHSQYANMTLSLSKVPTINASETGSDAGLLSVLAPSQTSCSWYLDTSSPALLLASAITVSYSERDPIPGACNLEFGLDIDPNVHLQYNLYETAAQPPLCDVQMGQDSRFRLQYDIYQYFLPENNLNDSVLLAHLQSMSMVPQISANGVKLATLTSSERTTMSFTSSPDKESSTTWWSVIPS
ncbi:unnamed protein product [Ranitomeya imitator]|uniref:Uncharacterized protein n=1 Tax=Ranitomeya imitator TaxID=111125 RepID=A0ABN9LBU3_9NEOB|nr:unnamed protein product [Ranitomeya imitator]